MLRTAQDSAAGKMFYCYRDNNLYESKLLTEAAGLTGVKYPVVSAVGAGGKTTTLRRLADEYVQPGVPVIVTTTTHETGKTSAIKRDFFSTISPVPPVYTVR